MYIISETLHQQAAEKFFYARQSADGVIPDEPAEGRPEQSEGASEDSRGLDSFLRTY